MLTYTNIQHGFRKLNELSCNEYVLLDMVYHLSVNPKNKLGWCYASKETLGNEIGLTRQAIIGMINRLCERGFMVRHEETAHLRTTEKWYSVYTCKETLQGVNLEGCKETLQVGVKKLYTDCKETLHNNNIDNNKEIKINTLSHSFENLNFEKKQNENLLIDKQKPKEEQPAAITKNEISGNEINYDKFVERVRELVQLDNPVKVKIYVSNMGVRPAHERAAEILEAEFKRYAAQRFANGSQYPLNSTQERFMEWLEKNSNVGYPDFNKWTLSTLAIQNAAAMLKDKPAKVQAQEKKGTGGGFSQLIKK